MNLLAIIIMVLTAPFVVLSEPTIYSKQSFVEQSLLCSLPTDSTLTKLMQRKWKKVIEDSSGYHFYGRSKQQIHIKPIGDADSISCILPLGYLDFPEYYDYSESPRTRKGYRIIYKDRVYECVLLKNDPDKLMNIIIGAPLAQEIRTLNYYSCKEEGNSICFQNYVGWYFDKTTPYCSKYSVSLPKGIKGIYHSLNHLYVYYPNGEYVEVKYEGFHFTGSDNDLEVTSIQKDGTNNNGFSKYILSGTVGRVPVQIIISAKDSRIDNYIGCIVEDGVHLTPYGKDNTTLSNRYYSFFWDRDNDYSTKCFIKVPTNYVKIERGPISRITYKDGEFIEIHEQEELQVDYKSLIFLPQVSKRDPDAENCLFAPLDSNYVCYHISGIANSHRTDVYIVSKRENISYYLQCCL